MGKIFEDYFSEIQVDMVNICMEYAEYQADKIYIYGCCEGRTVTSGYFYEINGQILQRNELNKISPMYDVSPQRQNMCLQILIEDILKIEKLCDEYKKAMPKEIKMIYDAKKKSLGVKYQYENQWYGDKNRGAYHVFNDWFEEVKNSKRL